MSNIVCVFTILLSFIPDFRILVTVLSKEYFGIFLVESSSKSKGTVIFSALGHYLNDVARSDINKVAQLFPVKQEAVIFTPKEVEEFNRLENLLVNF